METPRPLQPLQVFLCHAHHDKPAVRTLYLRLEAEGFRPWLDDESLLPGHDWESEIRKAVRRSDVVLVCLSRKAVSEAGFRHKEIALALDVADLQPEGTIFIIPVRLEECDVPERLRRWNWVDLFEPDGFDKLKRALASRAQGIETTARSSTADKQLSDGATEVPVHPNAEKHLGNASHISPTNIDDTHSMDLEIDDQRDSLSTVIVPDVDDLLHLGDRFAWLILFYDHIIVPDFGKVFNNRIYGYYRALLESGWGPDALAEHIENSYEYFQRHLRVAIQQDIVQFVPVGSDAELKRVKPLERIYSALQTVGGTRDLDPVEYNQWMSIIRTMAHTIGRVTFKKEGDLMFAAIAGEGADLQQQALIRYKAAELKAPVASSQRSLFLVPPSSVEAPETVDERVRQALLFLICGLDPVLPVFRDLPLEELVAARERFRDLLAPAKRHLRRLSFGFARDFRNERPSEMKTWANAYLRNVVRPDIEAFREAITKDSSKAARKVREAIEGFVPAAFGAIDWKTILASAFKASSESSEAFDAEERDRGSFVKLLVNAGDLSRK